ncbi:MAG: pyruvate dehydrogenase [Acidobacteriota bacterium]|nr:pyruvate dehydrogenase [Acidobacteriota bacterium]
MSEPCVARVSASVSAIDWRRVCRLAMLSREMDALEVRDLPPKKAFYQFSAAGHELGQVLLGCMLNDPHDAAAAYYRSRPLLLTLGFSPADALAATMARSGPPSDGRDIGVVFNLPAKEAPAVLPMAGGVGTQFTMAAGWAQAIVYYREALRESAYAHSIAVALGGEGSVATNGFWSALNLAATLHLPMLFFIEDNSYALSVPGWMQTPGGNIAKNLASFQNLFVLDGDGTDPESAPELVSTVVAHVREGAGPALLRLDVPRLSGHSRQDNQAYKSKETLAAEARRDPLPKLRRHLVPNSISKRQWEALEKSVRSEVREALREAETRPEPDPATVLKHVYCALETRQAGQVPVACGREAPQPAAVARHTKARVNMVEAIRRTLEHELECNPKLLIFGEDVGPKGGVHTVTLGLQKRFGALRVFDTSLSEEGIIGRAVGMALAGLAPVAEIQFRKYADPAMEQLHDCGTMRWRTANRFAASLVVRMACGFSKCGDPWHSVCNEAAWAHAIGWQVVFPSNAEDAVGLLRAAMRSRNPTIFLEHRALLDHPWARRLYPGDEFVIPMGKARIVRSGEDLTVISWGAMVERCARAADAAGVSAELIDLRTIMPWDAQAVLESVRKTSRCLIVHEDALTAGFGAEISAVIASDGFYDLDAPIERLAVPDIPLPYNVRLAAAVLPGVDSIAAAMTRLVAE